MSNRFPNDSLGSAFERTDYVLLNTISIKFDNPDSENEPYLYIFQKYKVIRGLSVGDQSDAIRLNIKKRNLRTEEFQDFKRYEDVPQEVLSVDQFDEVMNKCVREMRIRRKVDLEKGSSQ